MEMTTRLPFDILSSELLPGETVQWTGRPNSAVIFHREDWALIPFSLLWGGFAIFWLLGASGKVARIAQQEGSYGIRWEVLGWNESAIKFYKSLGGEFFDDWRQVLLQGDALHRLADG